MNTKLLPALLLLTAAVSVMLPGTVASKKYPPIGPMMNHIDMDRHHIPNGATIQLEAKSFVKNINGSNVTMYGYDGRTPGPLIKVRQGSSIYVNFTNNLDIETTVHWHGLRLKNKFDGVPMMTQEPVKPGGSFLYKLDFPDEGIYWYHSHIRDDIGQEMGLYGSILVEPSKHISSSVDKAVVLFLDDIKVVDGGIHPFNEDYADFTLTGRFGNIMLLNGEADYQLKNVEKGEIIRFYLTNSANTRTFNFSIENAKMKLIGGDSGRYENETFVDSIILGIGERYIVDVFFDKSGTFRILNNIPEESGMMAMHELGTIMVSDKTPPFSKNEIFSLLEKNYDVINEMAPFKNYHHTEPDYKLDLTVDILDEELAQHLEAMMMAVEPIEWEENMDMAMVNSMSTSENLKWIIKDNATGKENPSYPVKTGDIKKIRIFNDPESMHPMQHPMHLHGQRFLVLTQDGESSDNLVWKDTVLVPAGSTIDILVEFTNPGVWLMHCHIPEHAEAGMMASFTVHEL